MGCGGRGEPAYQEQGLGENSNLEWGGERGGEKLCATLPPPPPRGWGMHYSDLGRDQEPKARWE